METSRSAHMDTLALQASWLPGDFVALPYSSAQGSEDTAQRD